VSSSPSPTGYVHEAAVYGSDEELVHLVVPLLEGGVTNGQPTMAALQDHETAVVRTALGSEIVDIVVSLGVGDADATAYGCDLTQGYIDENAAYYSS